MDGGSGVDYKALKRLLKRRRFPAFQRRFIDEAMRVDSFFDQNRGRVGNLRTYCAQNRLLLTKAVKRACKKKDDVDLSHLLSEVCGLSFWKFTEAPQEEEGEEEEEARDSNVMVVLLPPPPVFSEKIKSLAGVLDPRHVPCDALVCLDLDETLVRDGVHLIEERSPAMLAALQAKGVFVMGLTSRYSDFAHETHDMLLGLDLNFERNQPEQLPSADGTDGLQDPATRALFFGGIVFTSAGAKGLALLRFLLFVDPDRARYRRVLFVDDRAHNLSDVHGALSSAGYGGTRLYQFQM